MMIQFIAIN
jgi:hypothetical protein